MSYPVNCPLKLPADLTVMSATMSPDHETKGGNLSVKWSTEIGVVYSCAPLNDVSMAAEPLLWYDMLAQIEDHIISKKRRAQG